MSDPKLTISIIGHNEAHHLKELLPSLNWVDEIIYVDCESQDGSYEVAQSLGAKAFRRPNLRNLNINKSFGMSHATGDWIFYLDPDERIPDELQSELLDKIKNNHLDPKIGGFRMNRRNHFFGKWLKHGSQYPDPQWRVFRKGAAKFSNRHVHEKLQIEGDVIALKNDMNHFAYLDFSQFIKKFDFYSTFEAEFLWKKGTRTSPKNHFKYFFWTPTSRFFRRFFLKKGFLDGPPGFIAAFFDSAGFVARYFKLWELENNPAKKSQLLASSDPNPASPQIFDPRTDGTDDPTPLSPSNQ